MPDVIKNHPTARYQRNTSPSETFSMKLERNNTPRIKSNIDITVILFF